MKIGDSVTINSKYSTFDRMQGVITEIVEDDPLDPLKYTVQFEDNDFCYFSEEEVK